MFDHLGAGDERIAALENLFVRPEERVVERYVVSSLGKYGGQRGAGTTTVIETLLCGRKACE